MKNAVNTGILLLISVFFMANTLNAKKPKNLKVLKYEDIKPLKQYMKSISKDLGVKCKFCHDMNDKSADTKHKEIAQSMMEMTININTNTFIWEKAPSMTCWGCHRGEKEPETIRPE